MASRRKDAVSWLINRFRPPHNPYNLKNQPTSLLPGGITYISSPISGHGPGSKISAPNELIAEVDRAYFRRSLQDQVDDWFAERGFDLQQPTIPKHLFEAAVQADFGRLPPKPVKPIKKGAVKAKRRKPKQPHMYKRFTADDALVEEAIEGLKNKTYPNVNQAAKAVAPHAAGSGTEHSKIRRLYRKIGNTYNVKT